MFYLILKRTAEEGGVGADPRLDLGNQSLLIHSCVNPEAGNLKGRGEGLRLDLGNESVLIHTHVDLGPCCLTGRGRVPCWT